NIPLGGGKRSCPPSCKADRSVRPAKPETKPSRQIPGLLADRALVKQPVTHDAEKSAHSIAETDFLTFFVGSAGIADWDLVDSPWRVAPLRHFGRDFRFESEAV